MGNTNRPTLMTPAPLVGVGGSSFVDVDVEGRAMLSMPVKAIGLVPSRVCTLIELRFFAFKASFAARSASRAIRLRSFAVAEKNGVDLLRSDLDLQLYS